MTPPVEAVGAAADLGAEWAVGATGSEWAVAPLEAPSAAAGAGATGSTHGGGGFGSLLADAVGELQATQDAAAEQSRALATGQTQDVASVVSTVEQARLSMELAGAIRTKAVEAYTDILHTQV